jgi:iron complex transport system substrate-binding protein
MSTRVRETTAGIALAPARPSGSRRRFLATGTAVAGSALLVACGNGTDGATDGQSGGGAGAPGGAFPVTVTDRFGPVTVASAPAKVVSAGRTDDDALLALGVVPVALYRFVPTMKRGVGVWAEEALGTATPEILTAPLEYEKVAALGPDLILDVQSAGDETEYRTLTRIAPTIGLPPNTAPNTVTWQESARIVATAMGRAADGVKLVSDTEAGLARTRAANPSFGGRTVTVLLGSGGKLGGYTTADTRTKVLTALGFVPSPYVAGLGDTTFFVDLSPELVETADADVVVVLTREGLSRADTLARYPTLAGSTAAKQDRLVVVEDFDVTLALSAGSVLSIPFAVEGLVPLLKAVME